MTAIIDYDTGNLRSVAEALRRAGAEFTVTADPATLLRAERVILPGVGEASSAMARLREKGLDTLVPALTCPVLGICIGMQLLCRSSEEGDAACLGIFPTDVVRLPDRTADGPLKVPHMGWDTVDMLRGPLFEGIDAQTYVYYVHSYAPRLCGAAALRRRDRHDRLRHAVQRGTRTRQLLRHAVPPRKERGGGQPDSTQLPNTEMR